MDDASNAADEQGTQAVQRALRLLSCCRPDRPEVSISQFAEETGLTVPTAHRIVRALHGRGYLSQDADTRLYRLGPTVMRLARVIMQRDSQHELVRTVLPHLERLRDATGETAGLHCPIGVHRVSTAEVPSRHAVRMSHPLGSSYPLHAGAAGKAILAWSSPGLIERAIKCADGSGEQLRRELPRIRKRGYALSIGETVPNAAGIAAPVFSSSGLVAGAISVSGPIPRWSRELMLDAAPALVQAAATVSAALGYAAAAVTA